MNFTVISDTHMHHRELDLKAGDVLLHCGDFSGKGNAGHVADFNDWLGTLDFKHKIVIAGNHDFLFENEPKTARSLLYNAHYLQDSFIEIDGVKIYGSPWQPRFFDWAFNLDRGAPLIEKWKLIPEDIDILLTHGPPYGIGDKVANGTHVGCKNLRERVSELQVKYHCFGHIHENPGRWESEGTVFINASNCDLNYKPVNPVSYFKI